MVITFVILVMLAGNVQETNSKLDTMLLENLSFFWVRGRASTRYLLGK